MKKTDVIIIISKPDDGGDILVVSSSASEDIGVPPVQTSLGVELGMILSEGFEIESTRAIGDEMVQYTLLRRRHVCDPCPCEYDKDRRPWK